VNGSRGNATLWKVWKAKNRLSTLPTTLGNRAAISTFPRRDDGFPILKIKRSRFARLSPMSPV